MHRNKSASSHNFAMVPRADIPRSALRMQKTLKTTIDATAVYPIFCEEVLPGDKWNMSMTAFGRLSTPIFPIMDNLHMDCFFFFCPNRLVWDNWQKFMGEQIDPGDSIDYAVPYLQTQWGPLTLGDYFGLPTNLPSPTNVYRHSSLPFRMYNLIFNEWFRDQNLTDSLPVPRDDGPDDINDFNFIWNRAKRHDYFTACLPFPQKGNAVDIPLFGGVGGSALSGPTPIPNIQGGAIIRTLDSALVTGAQQAMRGTNNTGAALTSGRSMASGTGGSIGISATALAQTDSLYPNNLYADFTDATAGTINALRTAFQIQKLLERDARGGTRYTEIIRSHFGVISPDARLQRPEYLGGSSCLVTVNPIAQTSATSADGTDTPQGNLAAMGTSLLRSGFTQAFTEHGYIIGLINVRADVTYQQGLRRHWSRTTRYDFYFPVFAHLGEQAVLNQEIFCVGDAAPPAGTDIAVFGYQERWAEYRYLPNEITGLFRSQNPQTIDAWHLAEEFPAVPNLNDVFITDPTRLTLQRALAVGADAGGQQMILDVFYDNTVVRPMPMYSVPGLVDHF